MAHVRKQIRDNVVTELTSLTTTGTNVFNTRIFTLSQTDLPCLCIYTESEESEPATMGTVKLLREMDVVVRGIARATANVEDTLDLIASEVETAITETQAGLCKHLVLSGTSFDFDGEGDNQFASVTMTFKVMYMTNAGSPDTST